MQEGLAHLELEAREVTQPGQKTFSISKMHPDAQRPRSKSSQSSPTYPPQPNGQGYTASYKHTNASAYQNISQDQYASRRGQKSPIFNPFPRIRDPGGNVPLSDEEKEEVLESARPIVLQASDPEMQLAWAQDALSWVETASQCSLREQVDGRPSRSVTPKVEHQLRVDALNIVNFLADQHHPKAEFMRGMWLEFGKFGCRPDKKEAYMAYSRSAEKGYSRAEYRIGMQFETLNNPAKAIEHYQRGSDQGDSASNYRLGMMILLGQLGMAQDYQRGIDLVRQAAATSDENAPQGAYVYGMLLARALDKISVPEQYLPYDLGEAKMFIEKAAYLGFAKAQLKMAQAYELCQLGCEFEPALSLHYNALAARQGEAEADMAISKWFLCGYEGVFEKNEELAFIYAKRAAQTKLPTAEFAMGYFYEIGMYVPVDLQESERWYAKAAEHGNKDALGRIESIKRNKTLGQKDHQVAISRIKSQYGSQRGVRPDRFQQKTAPMPSMAEDSRVTVPNQRNSYSGQRHPQGSGPLPGRPKSTAPYPDDDVPLPGQPPYPSQNLYPNPTYGPHVDRPSSAFAIRPLNQAATQNQYEQPGSLAPDTSPNRAPTLPQVQLGRPLNLDQGQNRFQQPPNPKNPYPQATQTSQPHAQTPEANSPNPRPSQPPYNQGYGTGMSQRPPPNQGVSPRRDPALNHLSRPERGSSITPVNIQSGTHAGTPVVNQPPGRIESVHGQVQNTARASPRPAAATSSQSANQRHPSVAPSITSSDHAAPPKKTGPATFEEMGIPAGKNESDCVSFAKEFQRTTVLIIA